jgi:hypothetical protein
MKSSTPVGEAHTLSKLPEKLPETFFPLSIIPPPTVKPSIFLPLSPEISPTCSCALHLRREELLKLCLGIVLLFLDTRRPKFARTFSTILVEGFATRGNGREEHISWISDEEWKRCIPRMEWVYVLLSE